MYQNYDISVQKKELFGALLDILHEIDRVCKKNSIRYFAYWGTLIGAVRHNGFIPWDDDIDIAMLREDYEKFLKACNSDLGFDFSLQTTLNEIGYYRYPARIRNNTTTYLTAQEIKRIKSGIKITYNCGTFVSIVPLDYAVKSNIVYNIQYLTARMRNQILISNAYTVDNRVIPRIVKGYCKLVGYKKIYKRLSESFSKYSKNKTDLVLYPPIYGKRDTRQFAEDFSDVVYFPFEDMDIPCPVGYDRFLTWGYGDYMALPPVDKRDHHHGEYMDMNMSYKETLNLDREELIKRINMQLSELRN